MTPFSFEHLTPGLIGLALNACLRISAQSSSYLRTSWLRIVLLLPESMVSSMPCLPAVHGQGVELTCFVHVIMLTSHHIILDDPSQGLSFSDYIIYAGL